MSTRSQARDYINTVLTPPNALERIASLRSNPSIQNGVQSIPDELLNKDSLLRCDTIKNPSLYDIPGSIKGLSIPSLSKSAFSGFDIPSLHKSGTIETKDAQEALNLTSVPTPTKSFCIRYLEEMIHKSPSSGPRTPLGSPQVSVAGFEHDLTTPPISSVCTLASGPIAAAAATEEILSMADARADSNTENKGGSHESESLNNLNVNSIEKDAEGEQVDANAEASPAINNHEVENILNNTEEPMDCNENVDAEVSNEMNNVENEMDIEKQVEKLATPAPLLLSPIASISSQGPADLAPVAELPSGVPGFNGRPPVEIVFSFDTTGSMSQCIDEVREKLRDTIQRLLGDVPFLKIAVIAHGDYCDRNEFYTLKSIDFTNDINALDMFVKDVNGTGGGDWEECYEYVLRQVRGLSWSPGTQRSLVMIGDAIPHGQDFYVNPSTNRCLPPELQGANIDWKEETERLFNDMVSFSIIIFEQRKHLPSIHSKILIEIFNVIILFL